MSQKDPTIHTPRKAPNDLAITDLPNEVVSPILSVISAELTALAANPCFDPFPNLVAIAPKISIPPLPERYRPHHTSTSAARNLPRRPQAHSRVLPSFSPIYRALPLLRLSRHTRSEQRQRRPGYCIPTAQRRERPAPAPVLPFPAHWSRREH